MPHKTNKYQELTYQFSPIDTKNITVGTGGTKKFPVFFQSSELNANTSDTVISCLVILADTQIEARSLAAKKTITLSYFKALTLTNTDTKPFIKQPTFLLFLPKTTNFKKDIGSGMQKIVNLISTQIKDETYLFQDHHFTICWIHNLQNPENSIQPSAECMSKIEGQLSLKSNEYLTNIISINENSATKFDTLLRIAPLTFLRIKKSYALSGVNVGMPTVCYNFNAEYSPSFLYLNRTDSGFTEIIRFSIKPEIGVSSKSMLIKSPDFPDFYLSGLYTGGFRCETSDVHDLTGLCNGLMGDTYKGLFTNQIRFNYARYDKKTFYLLTGFQLKKGYLGPYTLGNAKIGMELSIMNNDFSSYDYPAIRKGNESRFFLNFEKKDIPDFWKTLYSSLGPNGENWQFESKLIEKPYTPSHQEYITYAGKYIVLHIGNGLTPTGNLNKNDLQNNMTSYLTSGGIQEVKDEVVTMMTGLEGSELFILKKGDQFHLELSNSLTPDRNIDDLGLSSLNLTTSYFRMMVGNEAPVKSGGIRSSYCSQAIDFIAYKTGTANTITEKIRPAVGLQILDLYLTNQVLKNYNGQNKSLDGLTLFPYLPIANYDSYNSHYYEIPSDNGLQMKLIEQEGLKYARWMQGVWNRVTAIHKLNDYLNKNWKTVTDPLLWGPIYFDKESLTPLSGKVRTPQGVIMELSDGKTNVHRKGNILPMPAGSWKRIVLAKSPTAPNQYLAINSLDPSSNFIAPLDLYYSMGFSAPNLVITSENNADRINESFSENIIQLDDFTFQLQLDAQSAPGNPPIMVMKLSKETTLKEVLTNPLNWLAKDELDKRQNTAAVLAKIVEDVTTGTYKNNSLFDNFRSRLKSKDWTGVLFFNCPLDIQQLSPEIQMLLSGIDEGITAHHLMIDQNAIDSNGNMQSSSISAVISYETQKVGGKFKLKQDFISNVKQPHFQTLKLNVMLRNSKMVHFDSRIAFSIPKLFGETYQLAKGSKEDRLFPSSFPPNPAIAYNVIEIDGVYIKNKTDKIGHIVFDSKITRLFTPYNPNNKYRAIKQFIVNDVRLTPVKHTQKGNITTIVSHLGLAGDFSFNKPASGEPDLFSYSGTKSLGMSGYDFELTTHITTNNGSYTTKVDPIGNDFSTLSVSQLSASGHREPTANSLMDNMPWKVAGLSVNTNGLTSSESNGIVLNGLTLDTGLDGLGGMNYYLTLTANMGTLGALSNNRHMLKATVLLGWRTTCLENDDNIVGGIYVPPAGMPAHGNYKLQGVVRASYGAPWLGLSKKQFYLELKDYNLHLLNIPILQGTATHTLKDGSKINNKKSLVFFGSNKKGDNNLMNIVTTEVEQPASFANVALVGRGKSGKGGHSNIPGSGKQDFLSFSLGFSLYSTGFDKLNVKTDLDDPEVIEVAIKAIQKQLGEIITGSIEDVFALPSTPSVTITPDDKMGAGICFDVNLGLFILRGIFLDSTIYGGELFFPPASDNPDGRTEDENGVTRNNWGGLSFLGDFLEKMGGMKVNFTYRKNAKGIGEYSVIFNLPAMFRDFKEGDFAVHIPQESLQIWTDGGWKGSFGWPFKDLMVSKAGLTIPVDAVDVTVLFGAYLGRILGDDLPDTLGKYFSVIWEFGAGVSADVSKTKQGSMYSIAIVLGQYGTFQGMLGKINQGAGVDYFWFKIELGLYGQVSFLVNLAILQASVIVFARVSAVFACEKYHGSLISADVECMADFTITALFFSFTMSMHFHVELFHIHFGDSPYASIAGPTPDAVKDKITPKNTMAFFAGVMTVEEHFNTLTQKISGLAHGITNKNLTTNLSILPTATWQGADWAGQGIASLTMLTGSVSQLPFKANNSPFYTMTVCLLNYILNDSTYANGTVPNVALPSSLKINAPHVPQSGNGKAVAQKEKATYDANMDFLSKLYTIEYTLKETPLFDNGLDDFISQSGLVFQIEDALTSLVKGDQHVILPMFPNVSLQLDKDNPIDLSSNLLTQLLEGWFDMYGKAIFHYLFQQIYAKAGKRLTQAWTVSDLDLNKLTSDVSGHLSKFFLHGHRSPQGNKPIFEATQQQFSIGKAQLLALKSNASIASYIQVPTKQIPDGNGGTTSVKMVTAKIDDKYKFTGTSSVWANNQPLTSIPGNRASTWQDQEIYSMDAVHEAAKAYPFKLGRNMNLPGTFTNSGNKIQFNHGTPISYTFHQIPKHLMEDYSFWKQKNPTSNDYNYQLAMRSAGAVKNTFEYKTLGEWQGYVSVIPVKIKPLKTASGRKVYALHGLRQDYRNRVSQLLKDTSLISNCLVMYSESDKVSSLNLIKDSINIIRTNAATSELPASIHGKSPLGTPYSANLKNDGTDTVQNIEQTLRLIWEASVLDDEGFYVQTDQDFGDKEITLKIMLVLDQYNQNFDWQMADGVFVTGKADTNHVIVPVTQLQSAGNDAETYIHKHAISKFKTGEFGYEFTLPEVKNASADDKSKYLESIYHIYQYKLTKLNDAKGNKILLSNTPTWSHPTSHSIDKIDGTDRWYYGGKMNLIAQGINTHNPYSYIGGNASVEFRILDLFGNAFPTNITHQWPNLKYSDELIPVGHWKFTQNSLRIEPGTSGNAKAMIHLHFNPSSQWASATDKTRLKNSLNHIIQGFQTIEYQLSDPNLSANFSTSLLGINSPNYTGTYIVQLNGTVNTASDLKAGLRVYINEVIQYLQNQDFTKTSPLVTLEASFPLNAISSNDDLFEYQSIIQLARPKNLCDTEAMEKIPHIAEAHTHVIPKGDKVNQNGAGKKPTGSTGMKQFTLLFEKTYLNYDNNRSCLKVAQGPEKSMSNGINHNIWFLKWQENTIQFPSNGTPLFCAPTPIANRPVTGLVKLPTDVASFINSTNPYKTPFLSKAFAAVNLEEWASNFLEEYHHLLVPDRASKIAEISPTAFQTILKAKWKIAEKLRTEVKNIFQSGSSPDVNALDYFEEFLLTSLENDYHTTTMVTIPNEVTIENGIDDINALRPYFLGRIKAESTSADKNYSLSTAKVHIPKKGSAASGNSSFIISAKHPKSASHIQLGLEYNITAFDFKQDRSEEVYDLIPSTWLGFVLPQSSSMNNNLSTKMQTIDTPLPLRSLPASPILVSQSQTYNTVTGSGWTQIDNALKWQYEFEIEKPKAAQDDLMVYVRFNKNSSPTTHVLKANLAQVNPSANPTSLFEALAQFRAIYPTLKKKALTGKALSSLSSNEANLCAKLIDNVANNWVTHNQQNNDWPPVSGSDFILRLKMDEKNSDQCNVYLVDSKDPSLPTKLSIQNQTGTQLHGKYHWVINNLKNKKNISIQIGGLNILTHQSIEVESYVERNRQLIANKETNPAFIYQSPKIKFPAPVIPYIEYDTEIDLTSRSLNDVLTELFKNHLWNKTELKVGVEILNTFSPPTKSPQSEIVATNPLYFTQQDLKSEKELNEFIKTLKQTLIDNKPAKSDGLKLSLTLFSNLLSGWQTLVRLSNIVLPIKSQNW